MKAPPNSPSSSPLATLDDGNPKEMATATQPLTTTQAHPPSVAVSGESSTGDTKREETFQAYRTVSQVGDNARKHAVVDELQPISTPNENTSPPCNDPGSTRQGGKTIKTKIPDTFYSGQTFNMLNKLFGARLCAGMENKVVQDVLIEAHGMMTPEHHLVLCLGAWQFQANRIKLLSHPWEHFYRFAFVEKPVTSTFTDKRDIFAGMAKSWNFATNDQKTLEEITAIWQGMIWTIGDFSKRRLQELNYHLCPCLISQPHFVTAFLKSPRFLNDPEEKRTEEKIKRGIFACTALRVLDFIIEEGGEKLQHTCDDSRKAVLSNIQGLVGARGISDDVQDDLSNMIAYFNKGGALQKQRKRGRLEYTEQEDNKLMCLKNKGLPWKEIHRDFSLAFPRGKRSIEALQVRYCTKLKNRGSESDNE
ncbi:hypothetical protein V500_00874 [Pseudogymnoascus sp. VKM F-4518 (FW-2643)]|nr:hypothetical protein V500_00874 [Pseudogymnoascus sp. VKM F-4518 (FW-2643)]